MIFTVLDEVADYLRSNTAYSVQSDLGDLNSYSGVDAVLIVTDPTGIEYDVTTGQCLTHIVSFDVFICAFENKTDLENVVSKASNASSAYLSVINLLYQWQPTDINVFDFEIVNAQAVINPENENSVYNAQMLISFTYKYQQRLS